MASLRKRNGLWQAQVRSVHAGATSKSFHRKSDAEKWAIQQEALMQTGQWARNKPSDNTIKEMVERYLAEAPPTKRGIAIRKTYLSVKIAVFVKEEFEPMSRRFLTIFAIFGSFVMVTNHQAMASCSGDQPFFASISSSFTPKGFLSKKPKPEDIQKAEKQAVLAAWNKYVSSCMSAGRMQEYLSQEATILANLNNYIVSKEASHKIDEGNKIIKAKALVTVSKTKIDSVFAQASVNSGGDGAAIIWLFGAKQAYFTAEGDVTTYDPNVEKQSESRNLQSSEIVSAQDDNTNVEATLTESNSSSASSGQTTQRGTERTEVIRDYRVVSTAEFNRNMTGVLSLANYEAIDYVDVFNACGGTEPEIVEEELALTGQMTRETRKAVLAAARECEIGYVAIGTLDVNQPRKSNVEGYNVIVSISGEVLSLAKRLPKKVAAIGPIQAQAGGPEDNTAVRNTLAIAGEATASEIVSRLNAKGLN